MIYSVVNRKSNKRIGTIEYKPYIVDTVDRVKSYRPIHSLSIDKILPSDVIVLRNVQYRGFENKLVTNKSANSLVDKLDKLFLTLNMRDDIVQAKIEHARFSRVFNMTLKTENIFKLLSEFKPLTKGIKFNHVK